MLPGRSAGLAVIEGEVLDFRHQALALDAGDLLDRQLAIQKGILAVGGVVSNPSQRPPVKPEA